MAAHIGVHEVFCLGFDVGVFKTFIQMKMIYTLIIQAYVFYLRISQPSLILNHHLENLIINH